MTAKQVYEVSGGNYDAALQRLFKESLVIRLLKLLPADPNFDLLTSSLEAKDWQTAFRAVHTLKGVALNLSLDRLASCAVEMTEILRGGEPQVDYTETYNALAAAYNDTVGAIKELEG